VVALALALNAGTSGQRNLLLGMSSWYRRWVTVTDDG